MSESRLHKLGDYFVYHEVQKRYGITFERFLYLVDSGVWSWWVR